MKKVLVYGLGITGISTVKTLDKLGYEVFTYDKNKNKDERLEGYNYSPISDLKINEKYDFVVKSPGIRPDDEIVQKLEKNNEIISDIELSYRLFEDKKIISVTGTNGKTTTTSLITYVLNQIGEKAISVGNIGEGVLWQMYNNDATFVEEISSFQLHNTKTFKPNIGAILNISPDHIDWHGSFKNYANDKMKLAKNQDKEDFLVINHDDKILSENKNKFKASIYEFSMKEKIEKGIYLKDDSLYLKDDKEFFLLNRNDLKIVGNHNLANAACAMLCLYLYGIDLDEIIKYTKTFKAIDHRLEFVKQIKNVDFFNDSKATNVDSAIKAVDSFDKNIILIAGGYDKKIDYSPLFDNSNKKIKAMILLGQTKFILEDLCKKYKINYYLVDDMQMAVDKSFEIMEDFDTVLLSPASASWGMYKNYMQRGDDFKKRVLEKEV
ncbi:UDP-N-acetylmuramoyl-L-alanine--D-glutamate ligase [Anaerococcus senegalensis]|uniref:UDP-N-acetylmuramoyl-L-alanine--D-glutamate ligase n=1 Tax=Anaerococcus senegalensis TaxID=1288120 RepID=UPI0002E1495C|nr:UDP-N-acetylmuramoyl-L-alanine--D-glutamate ligase [Anaerococcus senegalensis]